MWWLLFWACLLLVSGVYVGARAWGLWGQTKELGSELAIAERRLDAVQGQLDVLGGEDRRSGTAGRFLRCGLSSQRA